MKRDAPCVVYSQDPDLIRRLCVYLEPVADVRPLTDPKRVSQVLEQAGPITLIADIRAAEVQPLLVMIKEEWPDVPIIVLGDLLSDPVFEAEQLDIYGAEDLDFNPRRLQSIVTHALECMTLSEESRLLKERVATLSAQANQHAAGDPRLAQRSPLRGVFAPLRHVSNIDALTHEIMAAVCNAGMVLRAGIFLCSRYESSYRLKTATGCRDDMHQITFGEDDPLVRWLDTHAQIVSRSGLRHIALPAERRMLERALALLGAELILPFHGRRGVMGWLFLGGRATGEPFDGIELQDIMVFGEHAATVLENAMLHEDAVLQKTFAENLLQTIPTGIVAADEDGNIRWFNRAAEDIVGQAQAQVIGQPVDRLGSRLADCLRRALAGEGGDGEPQEWTDPLTQRYVKVQASRLSHPEGCLGVVAFIRDQTHERTLRRQEKELERATFWTDLAASMSHEVRNPLVAIKTFAQLLPERYSDPEFRTEFSSLMSQEVDRLNAVIEQINGFANLPAPVFGPVDIKRMLERAVALARPGDAPAGSAVQVSIPDRLPPLEGDENALADGVAHLICNAQEALVGREDGHIKIEVRHRSAPKGADRIEIRVRDNGPGVPDSVNDKVFSPFATTKAKGMGLGLPITQRTVSDHNGEIFVDSHRGGTCVTVDLPACPRGKEEE